METARVGYSSDPDAPSLLTAPLFGHSRDGIAPYRPGPKEILKELADSINIGKSHNRAVIALNLLFHLGTALAFAYYLFHFFSPPSFLFLVAALVFIGTLYNTIWYHRYCSHHAFEFDRLWYTRLFLWTSPLFFRESTYAIPHRIHHQCTDKPGDPYGPHLGWLGNYFAIESSMKLQPAVSPRQYELICRTIRHIGFKINDYESYRRSGSVENVAYYLVKTVFAQLFWAILIACLAGQAYLFAWFSAIFVATALIRDFNWRGHGAGLRRAKKSGWEFDANSRALNQYFYGWIASEWHDNHHKYPFSANNGFLPGQIDLAFQIIKLLRRLGIVKSYNDAKPLFEKDCLGLFAGAYGTAE